VKFKRVGGTSVLAFVLFAVVVPAGFALEALVFRDVDGDTNPDSPEVQLEASHEVDGEETVPVGRDGEGPLYEYARSLDCSGNRPGDMEVLCPAVHNCPEPGDLSYMLWRRPVPDGGWEALGTACLGPDEIPDRPRVTPDLVLREVRRIGLPALQVHVQPEGETLVHLDTIFFAEPRPFRRTVQLLGFTVDVEADPASYAWSFGDGAGVTTSTPGGPYPDMSVTHAYTDAHVTEQASVDVTYAVRFRVDGGGWQSLDETVTADGPGTAVAVKEAVPVLSGD
jgi:hypothetical protein